MDTRHQWDALLQVIHHVSMVEELDHFGPTVLEEIEELIPADSASFNEVDPLAGRATIVNRPRPATAAEVEVWQKWSHQNPSLMYMLRTNDGSARRISDFLTTDELHRLQLYVHVSGP